MYILSQCTHAIITQLSTFGMCIVNLGSIKNTWLAVTNYTTMEGGQDIEPITQKRMKQC